MNDVCTTRQAAERLGVSLRTVQLWVESGVLKAWKTAGGHRRVARDSVEALVRKKREALGEVAAPATPKILVIEEDPDIAMLYRLTIGGWELPVDVITASNGVDGLTLLGRFRPAILIFDITAPGPDGLETIRLLRNNPEHDTMSMIVVSSLNKEEIAKRGGLPDNVSYFCKPIPFDAIESQIRQQLDEGIPADGPIARKARA